MRVSGRRLMVALGMGALFALLPPPAQQALALNPQGSTPATSRAARLDLRTAVIVASPRATARERKAVQVLVEEVQKRTLIALPVETGWPAAGPATASSSARQSAPAWPSSSAWCRQTG